jgi:adenine phosphoribosyltransferase
MNTRRAPLSSAGTAGPPSSRADGRTDSGAPPRSASAQLLTALRAAIREVPDFPTPGIIFKDVAPLLADAALFRHATDAMAAPFADGGITHVVAVEARGFIFGAPVAQRLGAGFIPVRKAGKLPWQTERIEYALEYASGILEIHRDAFAPGARVLVVDDVLATGGTAAATGALVERLGAEVVGFAVLIELSFLHGRAALQHRRVEALLSY